MSIHITIAVDVCHDDDPEHPVASVRRIGGGRYRLSSPGSEEVVYDTLKQALAAADKIDASVIHPDVIHAKNLVAAKDAQIAELEAALAVSTE